MSHVEVLGLLCSAAALTLSLYVLVFRIKDIENGYQVMWLFLFRRARAEIINKGLGEERSPLRIKPEAIALFPPELITSIRSFYRGLGRHPTSRELLLDIERRFGARIVAEVCIPQGLFEGACLLIALAVATGNPTVESPDI